MSNMIKSKKSQPITFSEKVMGQGKIRTRIAPSPTGNLHLGTAKAALFNYLFAKKYKGKFVLRIEDTDLERSDKKFEKDILEGLSWLGIKWNEGPYRQTERLDIYEKYLNKLLHEKKAFWCCHTKDELEKEKEEQIARKESPRHICEHKSEINSHPSGGHLKGEKFKIQNSKQKSGIIRLNTPQKIVKFNDLIRGEISFNTSFLGDISLAKDTRTPLYNFAVVIDDYEMKISHIIRGEDHISNTPKQILIQEALGFPVPHYAHLPLILGHDKSKLSKRHGATSVNVYRAEGYLSEAMVNFITLLGWAPSDNREIFSIKELIKEFSLKRVQKGGAVFNIDKLNWINGYYIRKMSVKKLTEVCLPYLEKFQITNYDPSGHHLQGDKLQTSFAGEARRANSKIQIENSKLKDQKYLEKIIKLEQPRLVKLSEITEKTDYFFSEPKYEKELLKWKNMNDNEIKESLEKSAEIADKIPEIKFKLKNIEKVFLKEAEEFQDRGRLLWPFRVALSGKSSSPGPFEIADILGKNEVLKRLKKALKI